MSPHTAWLILQGIETLPLRMARHVENTRKVVEFLAAHPMVARVGYPELEGHPEPCAGEEAAAARLRRGVQLRPERQPPQGVAFIEALKIFSHLANVGDCRSLVIHPASTTHFRMDDAALARPASGRAPSACRSAWKTPDDLIDDLKRALKAAEKA
jgi:O-acetylhomoserine (thiol)-lyase